MKPVISVVIPVKNGAKTIDNCLKGIFSQTLKNFIEVIVIDSGSTDNTLDIIEKYSVRLFEISPEEFNHGLTRNYGVAKALGECVVLTVQDAVPANNEWLEIMYSHFNDEEVAAVCGQQVTPHHIDKNPLEWFRPFSEPKPGTIQFIPGEFEKLEPEEQFEKCRWDDVTTMYRKRILTEIPFRETNFAEDMLWARDALKKGAKLVYDFNARVFHYHHSTFKFSFRRTYTVHYHILQYFSFNRKYENFFRRLILIFYRIFILKHAPNKKLYWTFYNLRLLVAQYCAIILIKLGHILLSPGWQRKMHQIFVGKPPQAQTSRAIN
jgi:glycosyltransferase involved in cell wall biosynthesis